MNDSVQEEYLIPKQRKQQNYSLIARVIVEFLGTLTFVFFGAGTASHPKVELTAVSAAHGVITMILVFVFGPVSGHFNAGPTIAFGFADLFRGDEPRGRKFGEIILYLIAQAAGAVAGGFMVLAVYNTKSTLGTPSVDFEHGVTVWNGFCIELFGTFFLMLVINMVSNSKPAAASIAIGATLFCVFLVGAPLDGAAMNPWRWLGPAMASGYFKKQQDYFWIYFAGPVLGFIAGHIFYLLLSRVLKPRY